MEDFSSTSEGRTFLAPKKGGQPPKPCDRLTSSRSPPPNWLPSTGSTAPRARCGCALARKASCLPPRTAGTPERSPPRAHERHEHLALDQALQRRGHQGRPAAGQAQKHTADSSRTSRRSWKRASAFSGAAMRGRNRCSRSSVRTHHFLRDCKGMAEDLYRTYIVVCCRLSVVVSPRLSPFPHFFSLAEGGRVKVFTAK